MMKLNYRVNAWGKKVQEMHLRIHECVYMIIIMIVNDQELTDFKVEMYVVK